MAVLFVPALIPAGSLKSTLATGARWRFYVTGTTNLQDIYTTDALTTEHTNPVVSDSAGIFDPIYLDQAVIYRAQLLTADGVLVPGFDIDPYNPADSFIVSAASITAAMLAAGAAAASLGFTPANKAGDTLTGDLILALAPPTLNALSAGFRGAPSATHNATYTLVLADAGTLLLHTDATARAWTIPPNASVGLPIGTMVMAVNSGTGAVTLTRGAGVSLRIAGNSVDGNKTLAQYGVATLLKYATDDWLVMGEGLS